MPSNILTSVVLSSIFSIIRVFSMSRLFISGGWSIGGSASASVLPMTTQGRFPFRIDWFDLLSVKGTLRSLLQHHSSKASIFRRSAFFMVQLSHLYMTTGKRHSLALGAAYKPLTHPHAQEQSLISQETSPTPQFKSISSSALSFLYGPTLTSIHDYWKNHSFD